MIIGSCTFSMSLKLLLGNHELKKNRGKMTIMTVVKYMNIMKVGNLILHFHMTSTKFKLSR